MRSQSACSNCSSESSYHWANSIALTISGGA